MERRPPKKVTMEDLLKRLLFARWRLWAQGRDADSYDLGARWEAWAYNHEARTNHQRMANAQQH